MSSVLDAHPATTIGFYSSAADATASEYWRRMGRATSGWKRNMLAGIEQMGTRGNFRHYIGAGAGHCLMSFDNARQQPGFDTWLAQLLETSTAAAPASVDCGSECRLAGTAGCDGVVGSRLVEDRCGVCNGDGSSCAARGGELCSCAVPRHTGTASCNVSDAASAAGAQPQAQTEEADEMLPTFGEAASASVDEVVVWCLLGLCGVLAIVALMRPENSSDSASYVVDGDRAAVIGHRSVAILARKNLQIKKAQYCAMNCWACPCTAMCELLFPVGVIVLFGLLRNLNAAETTKGGWEVVIRTSNYLEPIRLNVP